MFGSGSKIVFRDYVQGTWGSFNTPAGRVDYIMTKARLGGDADAPERQLTKYLTPVREVMDATDLDFNQLLQRDLDDHRVAVNLIPYLLKMQNTGPAFFPPIMAMLLPFRNKRPTDFPSLDLPHPVHHDEAPWQEEKAGNVFRVHRLLDSDGDLHGASLGKLWWNPSESSLVVLDGQHRAMALLAIERTLSRTWQGGSGAQFRPFYEHQVQHLLTEYEVSDPDLAKIEVPVIVCWFPDETGDRGRPHEAARKLFVDVNKEARPPSESRIILLSDGELSNVLARSLLSALRAKESAHLPLYAVEYDNPDINTSRPARWSAMTNIHLLKAAVNRCVFGPPKYLTNLAQPISGRERQEDRDQFMQSQLDLVSLLPEYFEDGGYSYNREAIGDFNFPLGRSSAIADRFMDTWGTAILTLLSRTRPYAAHARSLTLLKEGWDTTHTHSALAYDAAFGGVGVYWTLRDSHEHFQRTSNSGRLTNLPKSDAVRAWGTLRDKEEDFDSHRAHEFLGSARPERIKSCKAAYTVFNTHACQLGMIMTLGSLWELRKDQPGGADLKDLPAFAEALAAAWNAFFALDHGKARDRKLAFNKDATDPINQITNMDTAQAVYFRYFWMQALAVPGIWQHIAPWITRKDIFDSALGQARSMYLELCVKQQIKALSVGQPGVAAAKQAQAEKTAVTSLKKALKRWFLVTDQEFEAWFQGQGSPAQGELEFAEADAPQT